MTATDEKTAGQALLQGEVLDRTRIYVDGQWVASEGSGRIEVINPATEQVIAVVAEGTTGDVDRAVPRRPRRPAGLVGAPAGRARGLPRRRPPRSWSPAPTSSAALISQRHGRCRSPFAKAVQVGLPIVQLRLLRRAGAHLRLRRPGGRQLAGRPRAGRRRRLHHAVELPARTRSRSRSPPPSPPAAPSSSSRPRSRRCGSCALAEIFDEIGLPAGVFNLVSGNGPVVGEAIAAHPDVDMVSFTGSTRAGKRVMPRSPPAPSSGSRSSSAASRRTSSSTTPTSRRPSPTASPRATSTAGQTCTALTRMLVPGRPHGRGRGDRQARRRGLRDRRPDRREHRCWARWSAPPSTTRVRGYIQKGIDEGARLRHRRSRERPRAPATSSRRPCSRDVSHGHDDRPRGDLRPGPVDHPVRRRGTRPSGSPTTPSTAWPAGSGPATRPARCAWPGRSAGQVEVNGGAFNPAAPFGGYKQSGLGREGGAFGLEEFLETKAIQR